MHLACSVRCPGRDRVKPRLAIGAIARGGLCRWRGNEIRAPAGGKNLEILGADVAGQCLRRGLVDEILVYVLPVLLGDGIRFSSPGLARIDLEPVSSTRSGAVTILRFRVRK